MTVSSIPRVDGKYIIDEDVMQKLVTSQHFFSEETQNNIIVTFPTLTNSHKELYDADIEAGIADDIAGNYASDEEMEELFGKWEEYFTKKINENKMD